MNTPEAVLARQVPGATENSGLWLHSQRWDLLCITGSSILVVLPLMLYAIAGYSATFVNLVIAGLIGGPHMYATFFRTLLDASFWHRHRLVVGCSLGIPVLVVACALWNFQLLIVDHASVDTNPAGRATLDLSHTAAGGRLTPDLRSWRITRVR